MSTARGLLAKRRADAADARRNPVRTHPESVLSGHTVTTNTHTNADTEG